VSVRHRIPGRLRSAPCGSRARVAPLAAPPPLAPVVASSSSPPRRLFGLGGTATRTVLAVGFVSLLAGLFAPGFVALALPLAGVGLVAAVEAFGRHRAVFP
jgi:hypothetical protein